MNVRFRVLGPIGAICLLLFASIAPVVGISPASHESPTGSLAIDSVDVNSVVANNTTIPSHEPPDADDSDGNLESIELWLEYRLWRHYNRSVAALEARRYDRAEDALSGDYESLFDRYRLIEAERGGDETGSVEAFANARKLQIEFIENFRAYHKTLKEYRLAKQRGDKLTASLLDARLRRQSRLVIETSQELISTYGYLSPRTNAEYFREIQAIDRLRVNVTAIQTDIPETLNHTTLTVWVNRSNLKNSSSTINGTNVSNHTPVPQASFEDPIVLKGQLLEYNDTAFRHQTIDLKIGERILTTRTDFFGNFTVVYRPIGTRTGEQNLTVQYLPAADEPTISSTAKIMVNVTHTQPTISIRSDTDIVQYGTNLTVEGWVRHGLNGIEAVPIGLFLGESRIGRVNSGPNGWYRFSIPVSKDIRAGSHRLTVKLLTEDTAIVPTRATTRFRVATTPVNIRATGTPVGKNRVHVGGRLVTVDGSPVSNVSIAIVAGGDPVGTERTDSSGRFETVIQRNPSWNKTVMLTVSYRNSESNLESITTEVPVEFGQAPPVSSITADPKQSTGGSFLIGIRDNGGGGGIVWIVGGMVVVGLAGWLLRQREQAGPSAGMEISAPPSITQTDEEPGIDPNRLIRFAREQLSAGKTDIAVLSAYAALRQPEGIGPAMTRGLTHWEFLQACAADGFDTDELDQLREVTQLTERAAFEPESVSEQSASATIAAVRALLDGRDGGIAPRGEHTRES